MAKHAQRHAGKPCFVVRLSSSAAVDEAAVVPVLPRHWRRMRAPFSLAHGWTNCWQTPALRTSERMRDSRGRVLHTNQKPLKVRGRTVAPPRARPTGACEAAAIESAPPRARPRRTVTVLLRAPMQTMDLIIRASTSESGATILWEPFAGLATATLQAAKAGCHAFGAEVRADVFKQASARLQRELEQRRVDSFFSSPGAGAPGIAAKAGAERRLARMRAARVCHPFLSLSSRMRCLPPSPLWPAFKHRQGLQPEVWACFSRARLPRRRVWCAVGRHCCASGPHGVPEPPRRR